MKTRLVQLQNAAERAVALVEEPNLRVLEHFRSVHELATKAIAGGLALSDLARKHATGAKLEYDAVYEGKSPWRLLTPIDHPEPSRCLVSGTGLTHLGSAKNRAAMHSVSEAEMTDSMKIFRWGVEHGRPAPGKAGVAPEWFYKGVGTVLRGPNEPLVVPGYAEDGGEEAEIAGIYVVAEDGRPWRIGMAPGNEFSDHTFEKKNYLNLAGSKLRTCSIGPEICIDAPFQSVPGTVSIERAGRIIWKKDIATGEAEMCHSLANIEHHHFKFEGHRRPGDVHVHYFGAVSLSFGEGLQLADGDIMVVQWAGFGRALRNPLRIEPQSSTPVIIQALT
jgi:hypothetical protein